MVVFLLEVRLPSYTITPDANVSRRLRSIQQARSKGRLRLTPSQGVFRGVPSAAWGSSERDRRRCQRSRYGLGSAVTFVPRGTFHV